MTALAQQELMDAPPARRLIVPRGAEAHWGVDVGTRAVSIASVHGGPENGRQRSVVTVPFPKLDGGERLAQAYALIVSEVWSALDTGVLPLPGFAYVEQPGSSTINWPLAYMVGIAQGAVYAGVIQYLESSGAAHRAGPRVETVPPSSWKKLATGFGGHCKPTRAKLGRHPAYIDYAVARWAKLNGYQGLDWNEADAWGIAEAARRTVTLEPR